MDSLMTYQKQLKDREFGKEAPQNFQATAMRSERPLPGRQGASEHENFEEKPTMPKPDSPTVFGIEPWFKEGLRFKCTQCGKCCTGSPGYVWVSDAEIDEMATFLKIDKELFIRTYTREVSGRRALKEVRVSAQEYDCVFLKNKMCQLYNFRPKQCRTFPWWSENLSSEKTWTELNSYCEGVNHPEAPLISLGEIQANLNK
jgi:Fe-S-cluster containining protein